MTTLTEVKAWLADQLPTLIAKYDVPGAVVTVLVAMLLGAAGLVILVIGLVLRARGRRTPPTAAAA